VPALTIRNLTKSFRAPNGRSAAIVDIPAFDLLAAQHRAISGPSGCGKTTLLHLIAGIHTPDGGTIEIDGTSIAAASEAQRDRIRATTIGYIFQTFNLLQGCTALENVELAMMVGRGLDRPFARDLLERVGLAGHLHHRPRQLSVGQQQRVAVARALANRPRLVLADEPTGNLDEQHAASALALIRDLCRDNGAALLLVSHAADVLSQFEDVVQFRDLNRAASA
jgi:putative ABC transport system ATP-binding protein